MWAISYHSKFISLQHSIPVNVTELPNLDKNTNKTQKEKTRIGYCRFIILSLKCNDISL